MLLELKVSNFAIIENIHIRFGKGLNILSGETGAGKSILIKSLSLLMGNKGSIESIRTGQSTAAVEGIFDLSDRRDVSKTLIESGIPMDDHELVVRRVLNEGKSRVYLNGTLATLSNLRDLVAPLVEVTGHPAPLIEMTGQHENKNLLTKSYHLDVLDHYIGALDLRSRYQKLFTEHQQVKREVEDFTTNSQLRQQRLDFLRYQRDEIDQVGLEPGEDDSLTQRLQRLKQSSRIREFAEMAEESLDGSEYSALQALQRVHSRAVELQQIDPQWAEICTHLPEARSLIEDALYRIRKQANQIESDPSLQDELESRLSRIRKLQKKFGEDVSAILENRDRIDQEIAKLDGADSSLRDLKQRLIDLRHTLEAIAVELHAKRTSGAKLLSQSVNHELLDLNMKGVTFHVEVTKLQEIGPSGLSDVEFQTRTSSKDAGRALGKGASGGELSRILLSLKRVVGTGGQPRTYLFDEVDTGVSGETAEKVGRKLRSIAKDQQVICVTHLPQVAAFGDIHFYIHKSVRAAEEHTAAGGMVMEVQKLSRKQRVEEIARLISGEKMTKTSLAHSEVLLKQALDQNT